MKTLVRSLWPLLLAAALPPPALAAPAARAPRDDTVARCSWDRPGRNAFVGDVVAAVDRYRDIPTPVRDKLKQRIAARQYDDLVDIRRDSIEGKYQYAAAIREMHFGDGRVCREVTRQRWTDRTHERGLVYCEAEHCILVPTVCRNVSRIDRAPGLVAGDRLMAPPGTVATDALTAGNRSQAPAGAAATPADPPSATSVATAPPPPVTSSFAEAVAGASVPLLGPVGANAPLGDGPVPLGVSTVPGGGAPVDNFPSFPPVVPVPGGGGFPLGVTPPDPGGGGGDGGGGGSGGGGGGGVPVDPGTPPVTPIPEPSTWASLLAGLVLLALALQRQRRAMVVATGAPKCATQKRS
jgi:hypothetical protein